MQQKVKTLNRGIVAFTMLLCFGLNCFAQWPAAIAAKFESYNRHALPEKLFLHTDRNIYLTGDILWFKVYCVDGTFNKPLTLSKVAYVEVLDEEHNALLQAKIVLIDGSGDGSFYLPVTLGNGNYKIRAYTSWMKNFSPDFYFEKTITVINPQIPLDVPQKKADPGFDIQFFPEGGNLVSGITSKVAFKAVGPDGRGIELKGAILNEKNDTLLKFRPLKFGMGNFLFTPMEGHTYRAVVQIGNNKAVSKALPAFAAQGYVMQLIENTKGQLDVTVSSNVNTASPVYIFAHSRQQVKLARQATLSNGAAHFTFDKNLLADGISHISIFNSAGQPVCERLYFKQPANKLIIDAQANQQQYGSRKKVAIAINTKNLAGNAVNTDLSIAVYRLDSLQTTDEPDILSYLWLSSDLQGTVESPGYYFTGAQSLEAADNLMLTQGWRRFDWSDVLNGKQPPVKFLPETYGHIVNASLVNAGTNKPVAGVVAYLGIPGKKVQLFTAKSDSLGRLLFNTHHLDGGEIIVQTNNKIDSIYRIDVLSPFFDKFSANHLQPLLLNPNMHQAIEARILEMQVQNVYAGNKIKQYDEGKADSSGFYHKPVNTYLLDNYTRFITMEEVLREYVREVNILKPKNKFHIKVLGEKSNLMDPMVMIDGIPEFDTDKLMTIDPLAIRKLEVVPQRYFYGAAAMEGILSFTSYKGNLAGMEIDPHAVVLDYEGMQAHRVFYSPMYDSPSQSASRLPDYRNLLYWSPAVKANGKTALSFYTSDMPGDYIGIVQGITADGVAGSGVLRFRVRE